YYQSKTNLLLQYQYLIISMIYQIDYNALVKNQVKLKNKRFILSILKAQDYIEIINLISIRIKMYYLLLIVLILFLILI
ncbi:MAG: hypothetical protein ACRCTA_07725, partial [Bacilli bacterium]